MKHLPAPDALLRAWLNDPRAPAVISFVISGVFLGAAGWLIQRNLRHNEPGLRAPVALPFALVIAGAGLYGTTIVPAPWHWPVAGLVWFVLWREAKPPEWTATVGQQQLADRVGVSVDTIKRAIKELDGAGLVSVIRRGNSSSGCSTYSLRSKTESA